MNIKKAKEDIKNTVRAYLKKNDYGQYSIPSIRQRPMLLMGPPGIGKTQIMQQIAQECNIGLVAYTITHHTRQSAVGLPFIKEKTFDGKSYSVTEYTMSEIIYSIYQYMEESGKKEGILFIDEINCVSETLAPTMLQFLQCKTFGNQAIPEGWIIVAAGNPPEYNRSVHDFDFVTLDRVRKIDIEADLDVFKGYARARHLHPFILSYLELRPQNFYRTENDVDGIQFVTARGWEDLSSLIYTYEELSIKVDEDIIHQFIQHEDIAKDVAAYYNLYQKYRDDYDISRILTGQAGADIYAKLFRASFDEHLSCVELLISGLHNYISDALTADNLTTEAYAFLKTYQIELKKQIQNSSDSDSAAPGSDISATVSKVNHSNGNIAATSNTAHLDCGTPDSKSSIPTENGLYRVLLQKKAAEYEQENKAGLTSPEQKNFQLKLLELLTAWTPDSSLPPKEAFLTAKSGFDKQCQTRIDTIKKASSALENAFTFMEEAFDEGQEMVVFVTELTMDPEASQFITENGCERYFKYNKTLLVGNRRAAILKELDRDAIYSNPNEYEF